MVPNGTIVVDRLYPFYKLIVVVDEISKDFLDLVCLFVLVQLLLRIQYKLRSLIDPRWEPNQTKI